MGSQKLGGAQESGGSTIRRGRPSSAVFLSGMGLLGLVISGCQLAACCALLGVPYTRSVSVHPPTVHGSRSVLVVGGGRAFGSGARGAR